MPQTIMIADDNREFINLMSSYLSRYPEFEIVAEAHNGKEALLMLPKIEPDILLLDIIMPVFDGLAVLEQLETITLEKRPHIIALTGLEQDKMIKRISMYDLEFILIKPFDFSVLLSRLRELGERGPKNTGGHKGFRQGGNSAQDEHTKYLQRKISDVLSRVGISPNLKGYQYVRDIITVSVEDNGLLQSVTKYLYPMVADKYETTPTRVERNIRHAIEVAWNKGNVNVLHKYFGYTVNDEKGKPTNSEFIAMVVDLIRFNRD